MESGFFWDGAHIDTRGLYSASVLNTDEAQALIEKYEIRTLPKNVSLKSKYAQTSKRFDWQGVVLACQNPGDRSINYRANSEAYWAFITDACRHYGKDLFLKLHPWNNGEVKSRFESIAGEYGCTAAKCDHAVIDHCRFVLAYNSTFLVDCMVRGVKSAAFVPGYFSRYTVNTEGTFPNDIADKRDLGHRFVNFLAYRYCFNFTMKAEKLVRMFEHFSEHRDEMFPMTDEFCYALNARS